MDTFIGTIDNQGLIVIKDHHLVKDLLLQDEGKELQIQIKKAVKRRSAAQNRWYWGVAIKTVINCLKETQGEEYAPEDIHQYILSEVVKIRFKTKEVMGKTITYIESKSTSAMSTKEFETFKFELQVFFSRKDIDIPDPIKDSYTNEYEPKKRA